MRHPRQTKPQTTAAYRLQFRLDEGIPDLNDVEKDHLRHLLFSISQALFVEVFNYVITSRGLEIILKVPPRATADQFSSHQILHLMGYLRDHSVLQRIANGLSHPRPRQRAAYVKMIESYRRSCCDLSSFGKVLAQTYSRWGKIRHPRKLKFWKERFEASLLKNASPNTIAAACSVLDQPLLAQKIKLREYPWCGTATPAPAHPKSVRAVPSFQPSSAEKRYRIVKNNLKAARKTRVSRSEARPFLRERIIALLGTGLTQQAIATQVGCTSAYVSLVKIADASGIQPSKPRRKPRPEIARLPRKQAQTLRDTLATKLPTEFGLHSGGFNRSWNRLNVPLLCHQLFGTRVSSAYLDGLLVSWLIIAPVRSSLMQTPKK